MAPRPDLVAQTFYFVFKVVLDAHKCKRKAIADTAYAGEQDKLPQRADDTVANILIAGWICAK